MGSYFVLDKDWPDGGAIRQETKQTWRIAFMTRRTKFWTPILTRIKTALTIRLLGVLLCVASFFLPAAGSYIASARTTAVMSGAECAYLSLYWPLERFNQVLHNSAPQPMDLFGYIVLFISGLINPVFLISVITLAVNPRGKPASIMRMLLLFMLIAPLYSFYGPGSEIYPKAGYFLWMAAMLLALFADKLKTIGGRSELPGNLNAAGNNT